MKKIITFIIFAALLLTFVACSSSRKPYCPTYADSRDTSSHIGIEKYNTVVSLQGDTTFVPVPYTPTKGENVAINTMVTLISASIVLALTQ